jgi:hypothetical protein
MRWHERGPAVLHRRKQRTHRQLEAGPSDMHLHESSMFRLVTVLGSLFSPEKGPAPLARFKVALFDCLAGRALLAKLQA